jgi:hypothetical protein
VLKVSKILNRRGQTQTKNSIIPETAHLKVKKTKVIKHNRKHISRGLTFESKLTSHENTLIDT